MAGPAAAGADRRPGPRHRGEDGRLLPGAPHGLARRTARPTQGQAQAVRTKIRTASAFLDWLTASGRQIANLSQPHLDTWIISHRPSESSVLRPFLSWARQRRLCGGSLVLPDRPCTEPALDLDGDQRWTQLHTCMTGAAIPLAARASGAVALLYGAALSRVLLLRLDDVVTINGRCHLRLGQHPVLVPPAIARLLREQADVAAVQPSASVAGSAWLFPSQSGPRPVTAKTIVTHLNKHGVHVRAGRTAALIDLAGQLPSAVLASLLGLAPVTADRWSRRIADDWAAYLHARAGGLAK